MEKSIILQEFSRWIKNIMDKKNMSPAELSKLSGVIDSTISRMLSGKHRPSPETLEKVSPILDVPVTELMIRAGYPHDAINKTDNIEVLDDPQVRALARRSFDKDPQKKALLKRLIISMLDDDNQKNS